MIRTERAKPETTQEPLGHGKEKVERVATMFDAIAPRYDLLNRLISLGLDRRWRQKCVASLELSSPSVVLDLACGTGNLARELCARGFHGVGLDLAPNMLRAARTGGAPSVNGDAATLPFRTSSLDGVVSGFAVRNFADLASIFTETARVLRPGGRLAVLEIDRPGNGLIRAGNRIWMNGVVPMLGRLLSDAEAYRYLPASIAYLPDEKGLRAVLIDAGFAEISKQTLSSGVVQIVTASRTSG